MNSPKKVIVAIDGPAGSGKSTVAKLVAQKLGYAYIDTGAMYRAVTVRAQKLGLDMNNRDAVEAAAREAKIEFLPGQTGKVLLDGNDVSEAIRTPEISRLVSAHVASYPGVRQVLVDLQRRMGEAGGVVMEGRDITTVVFPNAEVKVFMSASQEARANRRFEELEAKGKFQLFNELLADLQRRDREDAARPGGALVCAPDAHTLDTTEMTVDQVVDAVVALVQKKAETSV